MNLFPSRLFHRYTDDNNPGIGLTWEPWSCEVENLPDTNESNDKS